MSSHSQLTSLTFDELESNLKGVFDRPHYASDATDCLLSIQQGARSVVDYVVEFWTLAVLAGWNEPPLIGIFRYGLNRRLQETMALQGRPKDFNNLITLATELDNYLGEQRQEQTIVTRAS